MKTYKIEITPLTETMGRGDAPYIIEITTDNIVATITVLFNIPTYWTLKF